MTTITNAAKTETANENLKLEVLWIFNKGSLDTLEMVWSACTGHYSQQKKYDVTDVFCMRFCYKNEKLFDK